MSAEETTVLEGGVEATLSTFLGRGSRPPRLRCTFPGLGADVLGGRSLIVHEAHRPMELSPLPFYDQDVFTVTPGTVIYWTRNVVTPSPTCIRESQEAPSGVSWASFPGPCCS